MSDDSLSLAGDWRCRLAGCRGVWMDIEGVAVNQCHRSRCRRVLSAFGLPPPRLSASAIDALQNTSGLPAPDWPGCID